MPPEGLVGEGFEVGQRIPDVRLQDQHGDLVSTWQFWGDPLLITISAVWCHPCWDLAVDAEHACDGSGVQLLTALEEDGGGLKPEISDAVEWGEAFGSTSPIVVDPDHELSPALQGSYPSVLLVDSDLVIVARATELSTDSLIALFESEL